MNTFNCQRPSVVRVWDSPKDVDRAPRNLNGGCEMSRGKKDTTHDNGFQFHVVYTCTLFHFYCKPVVESELYLHIRDMNTTFAGSTDRGGIY